MYSTEVNQKDNTLAVTLHGPDKCHGEVLRITLDREPTYEDHQTLMWLGGFCGQKWNEDFFKDFDRLLDDAVKVEIFFERCPTTGCNFAEVVEHLQEKIA